MAYSFNGSSSVSRLSTNSLYTFANASFAIAFRFKATVAGALLTKGAGSSTLGWAVLLDASGTIRGLVKGSSGVAASRYSVKNTLLDGNWHSVIVNFTTSTTTVAGNTVEIYVDGLLSQATSTTESKVYSATNTAELVLGVRGYSSNTNLWLNGQICDVGIWTGALTSVDAATFDKGVRPAKISPARLVNYWPCVRGAQTFKSTSSTNLNISSAATPRLYL